MANILQQCLKTYMVEVLPSNFNLVPECQTHPEDQIRTCVDCFFLKEGSWANANLILGMRI